MSVFQTSGINIMSSINYPKYKYGVLTAVNIRSTV